MALVVSDENKLLISPLFNRPRWVDVRDFPHLDLPPDLADWILDPHSLTQRLVQACAGRFTVRVLSQQRQRPQPGERRLLHMHCAQWGWVRQVQLLCKQTPWVFARTVIPPQTLQGATRRLTRLGNKPLGAVLFSSPHLRREVMQISCIRPGEPLFTLATQGLSRPVQAIWGRRSLFYFENKPLLVSEIFIPGLPAAKRLLRTL